MLVYQPSIGHTPSSHNPLHPVQVPLFFLFQTLSLLRGIGQRKKEKQDKESPRNSHEERKVASKKVLTISGFATATSPRNGLSFFAPTLQALSAARSDSSSRLSSS